MKQFKLIQVSGILFLTFFLVSYVWSSSMPEPADKDFPNSKITDSSELKNSVDPEAMKILQRSMDFLKSLKQFSVQGQSTYEDLLPSGNRVDYEMSGSVTIIRPNKLRAENLGSMSTQIFYYDGFNLTLYNPSQKVYATEQVPGTIDELLQFAYDSLQLTSQFSDLLYSDPFPLLIKDVTYASVIGKELIGEILCDHVLFSKPGVDFQIWIEESGNPLPYKLVITDTATPALLSFSTVMGNWNLNPELKDAIFEFSPPQGTKKINFIKVNANTK